MKYRLEQVDERRILLSPVALVTVCHYMYLLLQSLILTVNLTGAGIARETKHCTCLRGRFQTVLTEMRRSP